MKRLLTLVLASMSLYASRLRAASKNVFVVELAGNLDALAGLIHQSCDRIAYRRVPWQYYGAETQGIVGFITIKVVPSGTLLMERECHRESDGYFAGLDDPNSMIPGPASTVPAPSLPPPPRKPSDQPSGNGQGIGSAETPAA